MLKKTFLLASCFFVLTIHAQKVFQNIESLPTEVLSTSDYEKPINSSTIKVDYTAFLQQLNSSNSRSMLKILLPTSATDAKEFEVQEDAVMADQLARKYPQIKSYKGISTDGSMLVRFDVGVFGLHASMVGENGDVYIDPISNSNKAYYYVYKGKDQPILFDGQLSCGASEEAFKSVSLDKAKITKMRSRSSELLEYRLALSCTGEWGSKRVTKEGALSDMVTSVNRLNQIFEIELGIKVKLIARNDELIFIDASTDPYFVANVGRSLLMDNTSITNNLIGVENYDYGHIYTNSCTDVGGVAYLRSVCAGNKAGGVSCFYANLIGITNAVVAHEMGHQFGANHTFNNCGQNIAIGNDYEPGSGSTIMSYGGLCGANNNVVSTSDSYYHNGSLIEIYDYMREPTSLGYSCASKTATANVPPEITEISESGKTIPKSTPFILHGKASDSNGDTLLYCWEEKDAGLVSYDLGSPGGSAPLFRSYLPNKSSYRIFPSPANILSNVNSNVEVLPSYGRNMNFALTVRDNNLEAGQATWDFVSMKVADNAGPFLIISPNAPMETKGGDAIEVIWDVANTKESPVNCKTVDIYLSIDGVLDPEDAKMILLASRRDNSGTATVFLPEVVTTKARLVVKATDNFFFDVSNANFSIGASNTPKAIFIAYTDQTTLCLPATSGITLTSSAISGYSGNITYAVSDAIDQVKTNFTQQVTKVGESTSLELEFPNTLPNGDYSFRIIGITDNADTVFQTFNYTVTSTDFSGLEPIGPVSGTKNLEGLPTFIWSSVFNASLYTLEVSTDATFPTDKIYFSETISDTSDISPKTFEKSTIYFWRVRASNACGTGQFSDVSAFGTEVLACKTFSAQDLPQNISQSGKPTIESKILVADNINISDLNVKSVSIDHDNFKDLKGTLISPTGTEVILWNNQCPRRMNINIGFDNDAPSIFTCATTANVAYRPVDNLNSFNGSSAMGTWTLKVEDLTSGNGGVLRGIDLEICGNVEVSNPTISKEILNVGYLKAGKIDKSLLLANNGSIEAQNLVYTVVKKPAFGEVSKNGILLKVGDTFTQADINNDLISYQNQGPILEPSQNVNDDLHLIVSNGLGGWEGIIVFNIFIENTTVGTSEQLVFSSLQLYPVPTLDEIHFVLPDNAVGKTYLTVFAADGKIVKQGQANLGNNTIQTNQFHQGQYFVRIVAGNKIYTGRFTKI